MTSYLESYASKLYSPRAVPRDVPLWYREGTPRKAWGTVLLISVMLYVYANLWYLYNKSETVLIPALPFVCIWAAYIIWVGYKLTKHG
jgi:hypothetical protein